MLLSRDGRVWNSLLCVAEKCYSFKEYALARVKWLHEGGMYKTLAQGVLAEAREGWDACERWGLLSQDDAYREKNDYFYFTHSYTFLSEKLIQKRSLVQLIGGGLAV